MNFQPLHNRIHTILPKALLLFLVPASVLYYAPDFNADFYYISSFDAVWKYPTQFHPSATSHTEAASFLLKDTSVNLNYPDVVNYELYPSLKDNIYIRWKNIIYKTKKSSLIPFRNGTDTLRVVLMKDPMEEIFYEYIGQTINLKSSQALPDATPKNKTTELTSAERDFINRQVFKKLMQSQYFHHRIIMYGFCLFFLLFFIIYLRNFQSEIYTDFKKTFFILFLLALSMWSTMLFHKWHLMLYAFPFLIFSLIISVFFNPSLAGMFYITQLMCAIWYFPDKTEFLLTLFPAGLIPLYTLKNINDRNKLSLMAGIYVLIAGGIYTLYQLLHGTTEIILHISAFFPFLIGGAGLLFTQAAVFILEKMFGLVSDFRLMELTDLRHPLLRQLSEQVPGTFHHTLQVSAMAEEAAYHLNANALLVRVGALYHDIGKIYHPEFFIENRSEEELIKNELPPEKCAEIIISHVRDGIELAYAHRLPEQIIDFIRTHHGTTRVEYFFQEYRKKNPDADEKIFRYAGPLPFNKETAILMLADSVEAASRALPVTDEVHIHEMVEDVFRKKWEDNQLIYSELTFRDIQILKKLFKKRLIKIYHKRAGI